MAKEMKTSAGGGLDSDFDNKRQDKKEQKINQPNEQLFKMYRDVIFLHTHQSK